MATYGSVGQIVIGRRAGKVVQSFARLIKRNLEVLNESLFTFPKNSRILFIKTPIGLQLMVARDGERLKVFWTK